MLKVGQVIKYTREDGIILERVLWIDKDADEIVVIEINTTKLTNGKLKITQVRMPDIHSLSEYNEFVNQSDMQIISINDKKFLRESEEVLKSRTESRSKDKEIRKKLELRQRDNKIRDDRWEIIKDLVTNEPKIYSNCRGEMIRTKIEQLKGKNISVGRTTINKYLTLYWRAGKIKDGLLPDYFKCGNLGASRIEDVEYGLNGNKVTKQVKTIIERCYKKHYLDVLNATLEEAHNSMLDEYFAAEYIQENDIYMVSEYKDIIPTPRQFTYWGEKKYGIKERIKRKKGKRNYNLKYRPAIGNSTMMAYGPGYRYQIDSTIADIELVSEYTNEPIGKPIIYILVDEFSRLIVSVHVGLRSASWESSSMCIYNATRNPIDIAKEYGVNINGEMITTGLPSVLVADNAELCSYLSNSLIRNLWAGIDLAAAYRPDWKPIVERKMKQLNDLALKYTEGSTYGYKNQRGERKPVPKKTLKEITRIVLEEVKEMNTKYMIHFERDDQMIRDGVKPIPVELWKWGMENRTGMLREFNEDIIKVNLMYSKKAALTQRGIKLDNSIYTNKDIERLDIFDEVKNKGSKQIVVYFDSRNMKHIYFIYNDEIVTLTAIDEKSHKMYYEELLLYKKEKKKQDKEGQQQNRLNHGQTKARIQQGTIQSKDTTASSNMDKVSKMLNRKVEKEKQRKEEAFMIGDNIIGFDEDRTDKVDINKSSYYKDLILSRKKGDRSI